MIRYRTFSIAIAICFLYLFGMVKSSHGFEITSMSVENGASGCYVSLAADDDISRIDWYLKQEEDNDYEHFHTSMYSAGTRSVDENIGYLVGSHNGTTYTIETKAWSMIPDAEGNLPSVTKTHDVVAYRPFHIVQLTDAYETSGVLYDNGNGASFLPRIETSEPYSSIDWTITGIRNCRRLKQTTQGNGDKTYDLPVFTLSGTIKGEGYKITATAKMPTDDGEYSTTRSFTVKVYQPKTISGTKYPLGVPENKRGDGIYGYVQLNRHYHDGSNIVVDGNLYAHNRTKVTLNAASWYRHTQFAIDDGATLWTHQDPYPGKQLSPGETYSNSGSSMISYSVGGDIAPDQRIRLNAHVHLQVAGQVWHEEDNAWTHEFTHKDNESYGEGD